MSLEHFKSFDLPLSTLLTPPPPPDPTLPLLNARQRYFADLAEYWLASTPPVASRQARLTDILRQQLLAQIAMRVGDHTLGSSHAELMARCVNLPLPSQRQYLPAAQRPQVYRPVLSITTPYWRSPLRGAFVIVEGGPEGSMADPRQPSEYALLCSLSHGIEAFDSLGELHVELCERLDDPQQSQPLLRHLHSAEDRERTSNAERLRYEWFNDDLLQAQVQDLIDGQRATLIGVWESAAQRLPLDTSTLVDEVRTAADVLPWVDSRSALQTRYGLLLERNSPAWLRHASAQGLTHIMQTLQELVIALDRAAAPGILDAKRFIERNDLLAWTRDRLRMAIRQRCQLDIDPLEAQVSITMARQIGPLMPPGIPSLWIPAASRPQAGDTVELVRRTHRLDELALLNVGLLDIDYWLTARVHDKQGRTLAGITADQVRRIVRELNVGDSYAQYLRTHLLTSPQAQWRRDSYVAVSKARMRAELAKARYAGHLLEDPFERGFVWASLVLDHPHDQARSQLQAQRLTVQQLLIGGHTLHGVMLIAPDNAGFSRFLAYTPDAPDRRAWREFRNARHLLRTLRSQPALRDYVKQRLPLLDAEQIERWMTRGGFSPHVRRSPITGDFQQARYLAEVNAALARVDASTHTKLELVGELTLHTLSLLLDLISLVLPARTLSAVALARSALSVIDANEAFKEADRVGVLKHLVESFTHINDAINNIGGTTVMRRAIRALPPAPPLKLPPAAAIRVSGDKLRYRVDGIHKEGIYEQSSPYPGLSLYYIKDAAGLNYQVAFDGYRWRVVDPRMPDAYIKVPVKRCENGDWVVDSPVLWYDGLPDLEALFAECRLPERLADADYPEAGGLFQHEQRWYLLAGGHVLPLRTHLLEDHYHMLIPDQVHRRVKAWAVLRRQDGQWRIRVRQAGRSSDWLPLPAGYSVQGHRVWRDPAWRGPVWRDPV